MSVLFPIDGLISRLRTRRVGLATTPGSRLAPNIYLEDILLKQADLKAFLALEHGLRGELQDGVVFDSYTDPATACPVFSFYGAEKKVPAAFFDAIDVCVFCVQDVSHRAYTFKQALASLLEQAAKYQTDMIILDRPSPLSHLGAQGPVHPQFFPVPLPVVIPYSLGELALYFIDQRGLSSNVQVLPVENWSRSHHWHSTGLPWIPPSPNIPSIHSAYAYAATGLLQATNISEGRGTCNPFEFFGAPFIIPKQLCQALRACHLPGIEWREIYFKPGFNKYAGEVCGGLQVFVTEPDSFLPVQTSLSVLKSLASLFPANFKVQPALREWLDGTSRSVDDLARLNISALAEQWQAQARSFTETIAPTTLYT